MKKIYFIFIGVSLSIISYAQVGGCDGKRYIEDIFSKVNKTTVQYAKNFTVTGAEQKLYMDIYMPDSDFVTKRPLIIWAYGGSFISGGKGDMADYCIAFAKKGYVTAALDYRLWPLFTLGWPSGSQILDVVIQAVSDMKGATRYFLKDADNANLYNIDPENIILGGISAGAITALHAANLEASDELPEFIQTSVDNNGGIEGNTGDAEMLSYDIKIRSVINLSGGLYDADWLDEKSPPFVSMHGDKDPIVPYVSGIANGLLYVEGSKTLKEKSDAIGLYNYLMTVPGGGHTDIYSDAKFASYFQEFLTTSITFLEELICSTTTTNDIQLTKELVVTPNPANDHISVSLPNSADYDVEVYNLFGQKLISDKLSSNQYELDRNNLSSGMYIINFIDQLNNQRYLSRVVFE